MALKINQNFNIKKNINDIFLFMSYFLQFEQYFSEALPSLGYDIPSLNDIFDEIIEQDQDPEIFQSNETHDQNQPETYDELRTESNGGGIQEANPVGTDAYEIQYVHELEDDSSQNVSVSEDIACNDYNPILERDERTNRFNELSSHIQNKIQDLSSLQDVKCILTMLALQGEQAVKNTTSILKIITKANKPTPKIMRMMDFPLKTRQELNMFDVKLMSKKILDEMVSKQLQ